MIRSALKILAGLVLFGALAAIGYVFVAPPDLLRVGTNYSAKVVCSNVFIAGRDAEEVLAVDVQAPGHPLLRQVTVAVDQEAGVVQARLFRFFAPATSQYRPGLGCTNTHTADLTTPALPAPDAVPEGVWPQGDQVAETLDPEIAEILADDARLGPGWRAVVVVRDGRIVGERYAEGFGPGTPLLGWSMAKSVTAALIGTLVQSGQIGLEDAPTDVYAAWGGDRRQDITVEDLLAMSSGLQWNEGYGSVTDVTRMLYLTDNMATYAATQPAAAKVASVFNYSSGTSTMLSRIWQDRVGEQSLAYPRDALFGPLGMRSAIFETDANDTFVGSSYIYATARDWARFGQFLLQGGIWETQQILPPGYTQWMFEPIATPTEAHYTKGHLWHAPPGEDAPFGDSVWLRGHDGQSVGIFPAQDMVVVRLGLTPSSLGFTPLPLAQALVTTAED